MRRLPALLLLVPALTAFDYGAGLAVRSEDDVQELYDQGVIDQDTRDQLIELLGEPLDPNRASRDELYQLPDLTWGEVDALIARREQAPFASLREVREVVGARAWGEIRAFVALPRAPAGPGQLRGSLALRATERLDDERSPVVYLRGRARYASWLEGGLIVAEQDDLYGVQYGDEGISVAGRRPSVMLERAYIAADRGAWRAIAGHYEVGFGQRLTFDVTDRQRPHGFDDDLTIYEDSENYDSTRVAKRLLGVAGTLVRPLGSEGARLELTAFASSCPQDIYTGDITPSEVEVREPAEEEDVGGQLTFPWAYREDLIGLNATLSRGKRTHLGATAWIGHLDRRYDFTFSSYALPNRPLYGAAGVDAAWGAGVLDLRGEVALTDTGGLGARIEGLVDAGILEALAAFRWYGPRFDNPHARAPSQPDEYGLGEDEVDDATERTGGWRDRDEIGPQVELVLDPVGWLRLRARGDVWYQPTEQITDGWGEARADLDPFSWAGLDLVASVRDKDLTRGGRELAYESDDDELQAGMKASFGAGLRVQPWEPILLQAFVRQSLYDHSAYTDRCAVDRYGWLRLSVDFGEHLEVATRVGRYAERVESDEDGGAYDDLQGQVRARVRDGTVLLARYELERPLHTTDPELEHKLKLGVDLKF